MSCIHVKCVICGHRWDVPLLTREMPMCPKCYGPVTVERVRVGDAPETEVK